MNWFFQYGQQWFGPWFILVIIFGPGPGDYLIIDVRPTQTLDTDTPLVVAIDNVGILDARGSFQLSVRDVIRMDADGILLASADQSSAIEADLVFLLGSKNSLQVGAASDMLDIPVDTTAPTDQDSSLAVPVDTTMEIPK